MKNYAISFFVSLVLFSCGGKKKIDGRALADEVCECRKKGKGLKFSDPEAKRIRMECSRLQGEHWGRIIRNKAGEEAFNKRLNECMDELIDTKNGH